jgi:glycosyltransferase involved in cell wall biosynthesis
MPSGAAAAPRIVIVSPRGMRFSPDGATSIDLCIRDFVRFSRHRASTVLLTPEVETPFPDVPLRFLPPGGTSWQRRSRLVRLAAELQPDLLVVHQHLPTAFTLARSGIGAPVLLHAHNYRKPSRTAVGRAWHGRRYDALAGLIGVSDAVIRDFARHWPRARPPLHRLHNGIDTAEWLPPPEGRKERMILFAGRSMPIKGVVECAEAVEQVLSRHQDWRAEFLLSEPGQYPDTTCAVEAVLARCGGRAALRFSVPHDAVREANRRAAIAVVPSTYDEPFGRTAIEAMACGAALIASRRGGLPEVVGEDGVLIDRVTPETLTAAIEGLIADEAFRHALAARGRARCRALFDVRAIAAALDRIYQETLEQRR